MIESQDKLWLLHCKNDKCNEFFDYFGRLLSTKSIHCTHCGSFSQYGGADFVLDHAGDGTCGPLSEAGRRGERQGEQTYGTAGDESS